MKKQTFIFIIAGILLLIAAFLRFYKFEGFMTFLGDQGRDALVVKRILKFEHFPSIGAPSSVGQIYLGPFYYYLITPFLLLSNFNPVGLGLGVAFLSMLGITQAWFVLNKKYDPEVSITFLIFLTFSFVLIELSRFSWNPNLLPFFTFLMIYFFYKWISSGNWIYATVFGAFASFCIQLHYLAAISFVPVALVYFYFLFHLKKKNKFLQQTVYAFGSFVFFSLPLVFFDLKHNFLNSKNFIALFTKGEISGGSNYATRFLETTQAFFLHSLQISLDPITSAILFLIVALLGFLIIKKTKSIFISLNVLSFVLFILGFAVLTSARHYHYFGPIYVSFYLLLASIPLLFEKQIYKILIASVMVMFFVWNQVPHYFFFFNQPNNQVAYAKEVANSFKPFIKNQPIQIVALPYTETDSHFRYFLELDGYKILPYESPDQPVELFVMCFDMSNCHPKGDPQWQVAAFQNKEIAGFWKIKNVTIYRVIHGK